MALLVVYDDKVDADPMGRMLLERLKQRKHRVVFLVEPTLATYAYAEHFHHDDSTDSGVRGSRKLGHFQS